MGDNEQIYKHNLGWFFYHEYFKGIDFSYLLETEREKKKPSKDMISKIKKRNNSIVKQTEFPEIFEKNRVEAPHSFKAKIAYPGLVTGVGIVHETGIEGEFKLGMIFDYASGVPVIHGSSVKGLLRSVFPVNEKKEKIKEEKRKTIQGYLQDMGIEKSVDIIDLEKDIFDGVVDEKTKSVYNRDIFYDAVLTAPDSKKRFVVSDSITPHTKGPLKNPTPLTFLKIAPGATMEFRFDLKDGIISAEEKLKLFEKILLDFGIGAKTNVGYGQFSSIVFKGHKNV